MGSLLASLVAIVGLWWSLLPPVHEGRPEVDLRFADVTVIVPGQSRREHMQVRVSRGRIAEIGPAAEGAEGPYVGAYLLPGLTDMHVHWPPAAMPGQLELFAFLHLYHGVTTVRSMGDNFEGASLRAKEGIEQGLFEGPRVLSCGPIVDGDPPLWRGSLVVRNAVEARAAAAAVADAGFDCLKVYDSLSEESAVALRLVGHALGLPVVGHVPWRVPFDVAQLDDVQHLTGMYPALEDPPYPYPAFLAAWLEADEAHYDFIVEESLRHGMAHTPTLVTVDRLLRSRAWSRLIADPSYSLLPRWYRDALWDADRGLNAARRMKPADFDMVERAFVRMKEAVRRLHSAGVPIHSGTDSMAPAIVPGAALHRELSLFVEAGLTPEEALEISMRTSPAFLGVPGLGDIEVGAPADLLLLRRDPTLDLEALSSIQAVVRDGRMYTREFLDDRLAQYRSRFDGFGQRVALTHILRFALGRVMPALFADGIHGGSLPLPSTQQQARLDRPVK
jgi:hypothetical protein